MADAVLRAQIAKAGLDHRVVVDSAGTGDWHLGQRMHRDRRVGECWPEEGKVLLLLDQRYLGKTELFSGDYWKSSSGIRIHQATIPPATLIQAS